MTLLTRLQLTLAVALLVFAVLLVGCALTCDDPAYQEARAALLPFARTSHRAQDLGLIEDAEDRHD